MDMKKIIKEQVLREYPELGEVTPEYLAAASHLGAMKMFLKANGIEPRSGLITHVGKVKDGILIGITMRGFTDPEIAQESYQKAQHTPVLIIF